MRNRIIFRYLPITKLFLSKLASFKEHIDKAKSNLSFLQAINSKAIPDYWDWQVTASFYVAVHVANAHLAKCAELHYRTHEDVKNAISPFNPMAICQISQEAYLAYAKLEGLSRRARYLCHEDYDKSNQIAHFTHDKHFAKGIKNLDKFLKYFEDLYSIKFGALDISCIELTTKTPLDIFRVLAT